MGKVAYIGVRLVTAKMHEDGKAYEVKEVNRDKGEFMTGEDFEREFTKINVLSLKDTITEASTKIAMLVKQVLQGKLK